MARRAQVRLGRRGAVRPVGLGRQDAQRQGGVRQGRHEGITNMTEGEPMAYRMIAIDRTEDAAFEASVKEYMAFAFGVEPFTEAELGTARSFEHWASNVTDPGGDWNEYRLLDDARAPRAMRRQSGY